jgi:tetratricopeptide (TPR) repeat protein
MMNDSKEKPADYQQALDDVEQGQYPDALELIQSYLKKSPDDPEALNDAGTILWCQGCAEEALPYLEKARQLGGDSPEILWNSFEIYLSMQRGQEAVKLFDDMERLGILHVDILNRAAKVLIDSGNLADALTTLERSLAIEPEQKVLEPMVQVVRHKMEAQQDPAV